MNRTFSAKKEQVASGEIPRAWFVVDATGIPVGRLATRVADVLRGKHKPVFTPHVDTGDFVIVVNAEKVRLTGHKWEGKKYHRHSGYPGGLTSLSAATVRDSHPERIIESAIRGMLPHNRLARQQFLKLKVYKGSEHPHAAQMPETLEINYGK